MEYGSDGKPFRILPPAGASEKDEHPGALIKREQIINAVNRINFHNGRVYVTMKHSRFNSCINVAARPLPCRDENLGLQWSGREEIGGRQLAAYEYRDFFYTDGLKKVQVAAVLLRIDDEGLALRLPEAGHDLNQRCCRRFDCYETMRAQIVQSGLVLQGVLADFNGYALAVKLSGISPEVPGQLNPDNPVNVLIRDGEEVLLAETCRVIRLTRERDGAILVLAPKADRISRFQSKEVRSVRQRLQPQPAIEFDHPFFSRRVSLRAADISGSGLSVEEDPAHSLLMPGLVIPGASITFSQNFKIDCRVQVLSSRPDPDKQTLTCGLVFLDMEVAGQMQLATILTQAQNEHSYLGAKVDPDELWDFFFETGFIYPEKYGSIQDRREKFKRLYSRLYNENSKISRHLIYRDRGVILGHVSMFRYYHQTWLLHHHAAVRSNRHKAGLVVMDQILRHINEVHRLSSNRMRYIACYFRPNNRFAARVFGGAAKAQDNPRHCSLDDFAYFHHLPGGGVFPAGWRLQESGNDDLLTLEYFYREISGGLLLEGLDLGPGCRDREAEIDDEYQRLGLLRRRLFFSLFRPDGGLTALLVVNISDAGLNLSDLTNGVQVLVVDEREITSTVLNGVLDQLSAYYERPELSVLLFPLACAERTKIPYDKVYQLTVLDLDYISEYLKFMKGVQGASPRVKTTSNNGR